MSLTESKPCPVCGKLHEPIEGGPAFPVIHACPEVPEGHFYEDRIYEKGPRGALHRLKSEDPR